MSVPWQQMSKADSDFEMRSSVLAAAAAASATRDCAIASN